MKKFQKLTALALGSVLTLALFGACAKDGATDGLSARICYDNLGGGYVAEEDTKVVIKGAKDLTGYTADGEETEASQIASYDAKTGTFTAVSAGTVTYTLTDGSKGAVEVVPAYITDPGNQYSGNVGVDTNETTGASVLGRTHDPSLIEVKESDGRSIYYIFSTGWADVNNVGGVQTYGNAIHVSYDNMLTWEFMGRTFDYTTRDEDFIDTAAGDWLYGGTLGGDYKPTAASWWAPDIVEKPGGSGYWLYTCVVDGAGDNEGMLIDGARYARACILLYESDSMEPGSFKPVYDDSGDPVVLMQSSIRRGETEKDVNGIDPQIIYDPQGNMFMAYGSFGSGNYIIELDPETGMRKDGKGWQTHEDIRSWVEDDIQDLYEGKASAEQGTNNQAPDGDSIGWSHDYYGTNISKWNMEAPVIARHDNVTVMDENETVLEEGKTFYYSMHSFDGLADNYQMWGGRSESVWGLYLSTGGGIVYNAGIGNPANEGNKYMGAFEWHDPSATSNNYNIILPGHNDLFTMSNGADIAAYITRFEGSSASFATQLHQYYLNSYGDIVINPNRYAGEIDRGVTEEELFAYTDGGKFKMAVMVNLRDTNGANFQEVNISRDVVLTEDGKILDGSTASAPQIGTWKMYGNGYIKFDFGTTTLKGSSGRDSGQTVYYGVVRPAWLDDQNKSGFTITCMSRTEGKQQSMAMFMNNYSTMSGEGLVGE